jgi:hypothetical protein
VRLVDGLDDLVRFEARFFNISFQLTAELGCRIFHLFCQNFAGAHLCLTNCLSKFRDAGVNMLSDLFSGIFQHQLIERH